MKTIKGNPDLPFVYDKNRDRVRYINVFLANTKIGGVKNFKCVNCGRMVFQFSGEIGLIVDSEKAPITDPSIAILCSCKLLYKVLW